jgi:predicted nucleotide-binding protein
MEQVQINEIKAALELFLEVFDKYHDEIISERPQRSSLNELRRQLQKEEPQIIHHIVNILGNNTVVIRSYGTQSTIPYANLLATALMGGNNELRHNFGDFYAPVTSILNRAIGNINAGLWPQKKQKPVNKTVEVKKMETPDVNINRKRVFVVHGRNKKLLDSMFSLIEAIGLEPLDWDKVTAMTGKSAPSIQEIISTGFKEAQAIIVLLSGDDIAKLRKEFIQERDELYEKEYTPQARPNVLFEAGMAMAANQERTVLVQVGNIRKFSDIQGLHITHLDDSPQKKQSLITKLKNAKCDIRDLSSDNRWMEVGNFEDKFDKKEVPDSEMIKPATTTAPIGERKAKLQIEQTRNLQIRIEEAYRTSYISLCVDFIDEYLGIIDDALETWKDDKQLKVLKEKGLEYKHSSLPGTYYLKWLLNGIQRLSVILRYNST